jgi:hypothetical protein
MESRGAAAPALFDNKIVTADTLNNQIPALALRCGGNPVDLACGNLNVLSGIQGPRRASAPANDQSAFQADAQFIDAGVPVRLARGSGFQPELRDTQVPGIKPRSDQFGRLMRVHARVAGDGHRNVPLKHD